MNYVLLDLHWLKKWHENHSYILEVKQFHRDIFTLVESHFTINFESFFPVRKFSIYCTFSSDIFLAVYLAGHHVAHTRNGREWKLCPPAEPIWNEQSTPGNISVAPPRVYFPPRSFQCRRYREHLAPARTFRNISPGTTFSFRPVPFYQSQSRDPGRESIRDCRGVVVFRRHGRLTMPRNG